MSEINKSVSINSQNMIESSLDRLKKDYNELQKFMKRLERDGEHQRIPLVQNKMKFLVGRITQLEEVKV